MLSYYKSYFLHDNNKINSINELGFGYKVFRSTELGIKIGEYLSDLDIIDIVYYYNVSFNDELKKYHNDKYPNSIFAICDELKNGVKISFYNEYKVSKYSIEIFSENGLLQVRQEFNSNFELVEYCRSIYDANGVNIEEKYFFADSFTVHTERMF